MDKIGQKPFVHVIGRMRWYDVLKQNIKKYSPGWFVTFVQTIMRPYVLSRVKLDEWLKIRKVLQPSLHSQFYKMYKEARSRWDQGRKEQTGESVQMPLGESDYSVWIRPGTCDVILYYDILIQHHYGQLLPGDAKTIIDCGANIGLASAYLLSKYPEARLIAIEPDPVNYSLCRRNLEQFGARAVILQSALWCERCSMNVVADNIGTWSSSVLPTDADDADGIEGVDMATLLKRYGIETVDILKIDVEGAEIDVFSSDDLSWIDKVRCFQIELENDVSREIFLRELSKRGYDFADYREITIACRGISSAVARKQIES